MGAAALVDAQAEAMKDAANNQGGAMLGFMGLNMAQNTGGMNAQSLYGIAAQQTAAQQSNQNNTPVNKPMANTWKCSCGNENTGAFCTECGCKKPSVSSWKCLSCGSENKGKFCSECGAKKPEQAAGPKFCPECGAAVNGGKFCPNCGFKF
jgi:membrane protease subunit (stomatin/prohibitin family)